MTPSNCAERYGKFSIPIMWIDRDPQSALAVLDRCIVVRAEAMLAARTVEYVAMHQDFDPLPLGQVIPTYEAVIKDGHREWRKAA